MFDLFVLTTGSENEVPYLKALSENVFKYPLPQVSLIFVYSSVTVKLSLFSFIGVGESLFRN